MMSGKTLTQIVSAIKKTGISQNMSRNYKTFSIDVSSRQKSVDVRCDDSHWLTMDMSLRGKKKSVNSHQAWALLCLNSKIHGPAKFYRKSSSSFGIRADVVISPKDEESKLTSCIERAASSLASAFDIYLRSNSNGSARVKRMPAPSDKIRDLCVEAGLDFIDNSSSCTIRLNVPERIYHAHVETCPDSGFFISVMITDVTDWSRTSRCSLSHLLLTFTRNVRMLRPSSFATSEGSQIVRFEVFLGQDFSARELDLAHSSLSVACQLIGDEASLMTSKRIAREYLALSCYPPRGNGNKHQKKGVKNYECNTIA